MNANHALCGTQEWADYLQNDVLPQITSGRDLGSRLLETGPGPGASTDWLSARVPRLVAVEIEPEAADRLRARFSESPVVEIVTADATALPFPQDSFDSAACFTMLHHVPTAALQNRLLAEVLRVLSPGGVLIGSDSRASVPLHHFHEGDSYYPVEPAALFLRLETLGYDRITISTDGTMTFVAHKPTGEDTWE